MSDTDELLTRARAWVAVDPDPLTREALATAIERRDLDEVAAAMGVPLAFGTAGLRGEVGAGPSRMNRATVIRTTRGLACHLLAAAEPDAVPLVVVGFDARPDSARFARDVVGVLSAAGLEVRHVTEPVPTPLIAYATRALRASAGVVITASHNPPADNGYKVFGASASQIVPPTDIEIAAATDRVGPAGQVPRDDPDDAPGVQTLGTSLVDDYLAAVASTRVDRTADGPGLTIAYTPLHGVGGRLVQRALADAGHHDVRVVASQAEPDGTFPSVRFPNPEEPGALDQVLALADDCHADLVLANDPDADRLAAAVPTSSGVHRTLSGNQLGVLLGAYLLERTRVPRPMVASSIVSSPMFPRIARALRARHETTLTGFKWICLAGLQLSRVEGLDVVMGYEEALGYAIGTAVRDKDGISAAVVTADLVRELAARGRTVHDRLEELYQQHGLWVSHQRSVTLDAATGPVVIAHALSRLADEPPVRLGDHDVRGVTDHRLARPEAPRWLPPSDLLSVDLGDGARALLRPSGTEPKCKVYVDLTAARDGLLETQERALLASADRVALDLLDAAGLR